MDGSWTSWLSWSNCQGDCGQGRRNRTRVCADPEPQFGGDQCLGAGVEMEEGCQVGGLCPSKILLRPVHCTQILLLFGYFIFDFLFLAFFQVNGSWTPWRSWQACVCAGNGTGIRVRARDCSDPVPQGEDGLDCPGTNKESEQCNNATGGSQCPSN